MANYRPDNGYSSAYKLEPIPLLQQPDYAGPHKSMFDVNATDTTTSATSGYSCYKESRHAVTFDEYFVGFNAQQSLPLCNHTGRLRCQKFQVRPLDPDRHSKLPYFMRVHGSVLPRMIVPLLMIGIWTTIITCISEFVVSCMFPRKKLGGQADHVISGGPDNPPYGAWFCGWFGLEF